MFKEFKKFIMRGSVVDLAVGIIIGAAFGAVVTSLVNDILMPPIGVLLSGVDFKEHFVSLSGGHYATLSEAKAAHAATLNYGAFINTVLNFLIVALAVFLFVVKPANRFAKKEAPAPAIAKPCPFCMTDIPILATRCPHCTSQLGGPAPLPA